MSYTDPIADMLTRIRNAARARHKAAFVPMSNLKKSIANLLYKNGYVKGIEFLDDGKQGTIKLDLKYAGKLCSIIGIKRISKPGRRVYKSKTEMPSVMKGRGMLIVTTSLGVMTSRAAKRQNVGGEVLAAVW